MPASISSPDASDRRFRVLACALAFQAGIVDALGFLHLKGFFVSFMSGNSTQAGVGLVERASSAATPVVLIVAFVAGVIAGSVTRRLFVARPTAAVLLLVAIVVVGAALAVRSGLEQLAIVAMAAAMGAENAALERGGSASIGVTYVTGALVKVGQRIAAALFGGDPLAWLWDALLWAALIVGATVGAWLYGRWSLDGLWVSATLAVVLAIVMRVVPFDDGGVRAGVRARSGA